MKNNYPSKYFDQEKKRLIFVNKKATSKFWDQHWNDKDLKKSIKTGKNDRFVSKTTKRFLKPSKTKKILEGGCGKGQFVYSLEKTGYNAYGIDYANKTVSKINACMPSLKITSGDVRDINFPDNYFDGYWSLGVIEHFFNGYNNIINEMYRVIKPGGYLFLTFPYMSPLRRLKAKFKKYPLFNPNDFDQNNFYQFALNNKNVQKDLANLNFKLIQKIPFDGLKGLKDEIAITKSFLQKLYDSQNIFLQGIGFVISHITAPFASHSILLIFKKDE